MSNENEIAWAAGLFDAKAAVTLDGNMLRITMSGTEPEQMERFATAVGGKVGGPYHAKHSKKPTYTYYAYGPKANIVADLILPYSSSKYLDVLSDVVGVS